MATHSGILAWRIHGQRSLAGYSPWSQTESDMTERLTHTHTHTHTPKGRFALSHRRPALREIPVPPGKG